MVNEENKSIFDEVEALPENSKIAVDEDESEDSGEEESLELVSSDFKPQMSAKSKAEKEAEFGVKKKLPENTILTIKEVTPGMPKTKKTENGVVINLPPSKTLTSGAPFYEAKLVVRFEEDNLVEYYPKLCYWLSDGGKINPNVSLDRGSNSKVAQIVRMALQKMSNGAFELVRREVNGRLTFVVTDTSKAAFEAYSKVVSDVALLEWMKGKKVRIETETGNYQGNEWFRNNIVAFI